MQGNRQLAAANEIKGVPTYQLLCAKWAKANHDEVHPLICHLIDVAQVTLTLWSSALTEGLRRQFADALGLHPDGIGRLIAFWAGLHDLGKASPAFQRLRKVAEPLLGTAGLSFPRLFVREPSRHGTISAYVLEELLESETGLPPRWAKRIARAVGGHHGAWPPPATIQQLKTTQVGGNDWDTVRRDLLREMILLLEPPQVESEATLREENAVLTLLSGLTSVADWIGSMERYFPYWPAPVDLAGYAERASQQAHQALQELGWLGAEPPTKAISFRNLFQLEPRPMQNAVIELAKQLDRPALVIIEAPTGSGKTEAALYLADHWGRLCRQGGMYVAMPTMATSNAMFERVRQVLARRYPGSLVNLHLVHSHASLSKDIQALQLQTTLELEAPGDTSSGSVAALSWFFPRRRTLLASFGVGTVDQALLSVLQTRHFFVRLFGLSHKTVIFDEVHAYDTYMCTLFQRLLQWLQAVGASVVILSATLPAETRRQLLQAYTGLSHVALPDARYPSLTWAVQDEVAAVPLQRCASRTVNLEWIAREPEAIAQRLANQLCEGGCAAVICNTVRRAQDVYRALREAAIVPEQDLILFHGRFPFAWRKDIEDRVLARFGKGSHDGRNGVVVATQVIEQSLDLDFDLMVSDVAPVDLLIQRAGRLHRHRRDCRPCTVSTPRLLLAVPIEQDGVPDFGPDVWVYERYVLLRSYLALQGRRRLVLPQETEELIENVYGQQEVHQGAFSPPIIAALAEARQKMAEHQRRKEFQAMQCLILAPGDEGLLSERNLMLEEDNPELHRAFRALTRLGPLGLSLVCLHRTDGQLGLEPDGTGTLVDLAQVPQLDLTRELAAHAVTVTHHRIVEHFLTQPVPVGWRDHPLLRHYRAAIFTGGVCPVPDTHYILRLSRELGLEIEKEGQ